MKHVLPFALLALIALGCGDCESQPACEIPCLDWEKAIPAENVVFADLPMGGTLTFSISDALCDEECGMQGSGSAGEPAEGSGRGYGRSCLPPPARGTAYGAV